MVAMEYSREHIVYILRRAGFAEAAAEALRVLPDPATTEEVEAFVTPYGITLGELLSRLGGSP
jgi:hypothetical protein